MKKFFSLTGMIVGLAIVLFGILAMNGTLGGADSYAGSSPYDSGYATFGGDYYTYSVNNTAEAAVAARAASSNLCQISDLLQNCCGLFMIGLGLLSFCGFGVVFAGCSMPSPGVTVETNETEVDNAGPENDEAAEAMPSEEPLAETAEEM